MQSLGNLFFDRVFVLNLNRDSERMTAFWDRFPEDWPFAKPVRFPAVDGRLAKPPPWWQAGAGAWGCFQSHRQILEHALNQGIESFFVLEDDAVFAENFTDRLRPFAEQIPADWQWVYLGGQHIRRHEGLPIRLSPHVYRPHNVHRSHAYGLRGRAAMEAVYRHLHDSDAWGEGKHLDHRLGELHQDFAGGVYVPARWLIGQAAGFSHIKGKELPTNFFPDAQSLLEAPITRPLVAVVGTDAAARNTIAAVLHVLGVKMGGAAADPEPWKVEGAFAAPGLDTLCDRFFSQPWWREKTNAAHRQAMLRWWASQRCGSSQSESEWIGGTHPTFCLMANELSEGWLRPVVVLVSPSKPVFQEVPRFQEGWKQMQHRRMSQSITEFTAADFERVVQVELPALETLHRFLDNLAEGLNLRPSAEQFHAAEDLLRRALDEHFAMPR